MREKQIYRWVTGILLVAWLTVIFLFSAQTSDESEGVSGSVAYRVVETYNEIFGKGFAPEKLLLYADNINYPVRKLAHMTEYAICAVLTYAAFAGYLKRDRRLYLWALLFTAFYALTDEIHQRFVSGRGPSFSDVGIDTIGGAIGLMILAFAIKMYGKHCEKKELPVK